MKTSLSHLPEYKQEQILKLAEVIKDVVAPEMIILFGSYATGTWVEDQYIEYSIRYDYISDYDLLVVTKGNKEKDYVLSDKIINRSRHITNVAVNCIIHEIDHVNEGLSIGQYFFTDIINEGILLYDSGRVKFTKVKELTPAQQKEISQSYFDQWFESASRFLKISQDCLDVGDYKIGAFQLHQSAERFYDTLLLVFTGYKPKTHNLDKLRQYAKLYSKELMEIFPDPTEDQKEFHLFDLLRRGYIDARYKKDYFITGEELKLLIDKVKRMEDIVGRMSKERISSYGEGH
jgi:HEPN domain-containing protein